MTESGKSPPPLKCFPETELMHANSRLMSILFEKKVEKAFSLDKKKKKKNAPDCRMANRKIESVFQSEKRSNSDVKNTQKWFFNKYVVIAWDTWTINIWTQDLSWENVFFIAWGLWEHRCEEIQYGKQDEHLRRNPTYFVGSYSVCIILAYTFKCTVLSRIMWREM